MRQLTLNDTRAALEEDVAAALGSRYAWALHTEPVKRAIDAAADLIFVGEKLRAGDEFWSTMVYPEGLTAEGVRGELADFHFMMQQVSEIYMALTGGKLSKQMYYARTILSVFEDMIEDRVEEGMVEQMPHLFEQMRGSDRNAVEQPCRGCGKALVVENAWMEDGCPCNTPAGVNNLNLYRWKLLHDLQQQHSYQLSAGQRSYTDTYRSNDGPH